MMTDNDKRLFSETQVIEIYQIEIAELKKQIAALVEALEAAQKFIHPFSSFMGKEGATEKKIKAAFALVEGKETTKNKE